MDSAHSSFTFIGHEADLDTGEIRFFYELVHQGTVHAFTERLAFQPTTDPPPAETMQPILNVLLVMLGISYWKTYCPGDIRIRPFTLKREQADFWNDFYTKGLGEFWYRNHLDFRGRVRFPSAAGVPPSIPSRRMSDRSLVLLGGGKDSIVSGELLKAHTKTFSFFAMNPVPLQDAIARKFGVPYLTVRRILDPQLFHLNAREHVYNGHVPITAIYSCMGLLAAALYDYRYVVASNEASASYGNVEYLGTTINHQWSKSYEFERAFQTYVHRYVTRDITYFSLLRPVHEVKIVSLFTKYHEYFPLFSSCNRNFKISGPEPGVVWCGECPKCAFVFLLLAAFLPKAQVVGIFGKNVFANPSLLKTYRELLGFEGFKPFECVGTPEESLWAFREVIKRGEFGGDVIIQKLSSEVRGQSREIDSFAHVVLGRSETHAIPAGFRGLAASL